MQSFRLDDAVFSLTSVLVDYRIDATESCIHDKSSLLNPIGGSTVWLLKWFF